MKKISSSLKPKFEHSVCSGKSYFFVLIHAFHKLFKQIREYTNTPALVPQVEGPKYFWVKIIMIEFSMTRRLVKVSGGKSFGY